MHKPYDFSDIQQICYRMGFLLFVIDLWLKVEENLIPARSDVTRYENKVNVFDKMTYSKEDFLIINGLSYSMSFLFIYRKSTRVQRKYWYRWYFISGRASSTLTHAWSHCISCYHQSMLHSATCNTGAYIDTSSFRGMYKHRADKHLEG